MQKKSGKGNIQKGVFILGYTLYVYNRWIYTRINLVLQKNNKNVKNLEHPSKFSLHNVITTFGFVESPPDFTKLSNCRRRRKEPLIEWTQKFCPGSLLHQNWL